MNWFYTLITSLACMNLFQAGAGAASPSEVTRPDLHKIPVIDVTDLYQPPQDVGDNFDLLAAYALPEVDLKAVILDCTDVFRQPVATNPGPGLFADPNGPREPGFIPVMQLNYIFNRSVPAAVGPFARMKSPQARMTEAPAFQQQGVELILQVLRTNPTPVQVLSFGSARPIAVAFNREPELFREKVACIHLNAGASAPGYLEWNVALDTNAIVCLLRSGLPLALYPCAADNSRGVGYGVHSPAHSYDSHDTYYKLPNTLFIQNLQPRLRRYLEFAFTRSGRGDFLRAMDADASPFAEAKVLSREHYVWETAAWLCALNRRLDSHADGHCQIVRANEVRADDKVLPNELHGCEVSVTDAGIYSVKESKSSNCRIYFRGAPEENERALQEALPKLYLSFAP